MSLLNGFTYRCRFTLPDGEVIEDSFHNLMPQQGVDFLADLILGNTAPLPALYLGLVGANYVPTKASTASNLPAIEATAYSGAGRPQWLGQFDGVSLLSNENSLAEFVFTADVTLYGAFIASSATKADGGGVLLSIGRFASPRPLPAGTTFSCSAEIPLIATDF